MFFFELRFHLCLLRIAFLQLRLARLHLVRLSHVIGWLLRVGIRVGIRLGVGVGVRAIAPLAVPVVREALVHISPPGAK